MSLINIQLLSLLLSMKVSCHDDNIKHIKYYYLFYIDVSPFCSPTKLTPIDHDNQQYPTAVPPSLYQGKLS